MGKGRVKMDNKKNNTESKTIEISNYCETCAFLCKCDKEYCPNHMSPYEARRINQKMEIERLRRIDEIYQRNIGGKIER